ncbi:hypothetical protein [Blastococcus saxobsidens]|uniref:Uncharacterized protein n=1 Tax=Blastococcus saxobsidens TaxID=138336 RepID=A0A4V2G2D4_9ACTN|nr:hypothetical protein [Blastococcus saxobsidens]RZU32696.1 hypothetical protein BKA19_2397 [Blastococcus saxobsidens]
MSTTARGACQICGTSRTLRRDGTVREHWETSTSHRCMGSGWPPVDPAEDCCECGKPASHLTAAEDSPEWGCRVPIGMVNGRLIYPPLAAELSDPSATTSAIH